jgi:hypothetical protein
MFFFLVRDTSYSTHTLTLARISHLSDINIAIFLIDVTSYLFFPVLGLCMHLATFSGDTLRILGILRTYSDFTFCSLPISRTVSCVPFSFGFCFFLSPFFCLGMVRTGFSLFARNGPTYPLCVRYQTILCFADGICSSLVMSSSPSL